MGMFCQSCGAIVADEAKFCSNCGQRLESSNHPIPNETASASADGTATQPESTFVPPSYEDQHYISALASGTTCGTRFFAWETSVGATIGGLAVLAVLDRLFERLIPWLYGMNGMVAFVALLATSTVFVAYRIASLVYSLGVYPTFFEPTPKLTDNVKISFLNGMFGGIVFGCLWNANVTKGKVGNSCVVYAVLGTLQLFWFLVVAFFRLGGVS